jgi:hypothetical protein
MTGNGIIEKEVSGTYLFKRMGTLSLELNDTHIHTRSHNKTGKKYL